MASRCGPNVDVIAFLDIGKAFRNGVDLGIFLQGNLTSIDLYMR
jgi:hypothetical protein